MSGDAAAFGLFCVENMKTRRAIVSPNGDGRSSDVSRKRRAVGSRRHYLTLRNGRRRKQTVGG
jgi:phage protein U